MVGERRPTRRGGFLTVEYVAVIGLSLVVFTMLANVVVVQYGRGVVRATLDEAARAGARAAGPPAAAVDRCRRVAARGRAAYLGGRLGDRVGFRCRVAAGRVAVTARVVFPSWVPGVPDWRFTAEASARREAVP